MPSLPTAPDPYGLPDPLVTGSLYCSGCLDQALLAMVPWRAVLRRLGDGDSSYLWCVRYARGGEHLKLRVHGPPQLQAAIREGLAKTAEDLLAALGPRPEGEERRVRPDAIPIDLEDREPDVQPDRSFRFTHYERSQVSLGGEPFLSDDGYRARMTVCLAKGCDLVLSALDGTGRALAHGERQRLLMRAVVSGLAALGLPVDRATSYLAYHRDWLIRFPLLRKGGDGAKANAILAGLDRRSGVAKSTVAALRAAIERTWGEAATGAEGSADEAAWRLGLGELRRYVGRLVSEPDERLDPFAEDPTFTPLFKVLHGLANQVGLRSLDEAYAYHLLLCAAATDRSRFQRIALTPG